MNRHAMPLPTDTRWKRALDSVLRFARRDAPATADDEDQIVFLRRLFSSLVQDLPADPRCALDVRILHARSRNELWHLRSHLFGAISLQFGEHEARERLQRLDAHWH
jgi:hypothetical protein